jgi:hypothetical protein
MTTEQTRVDVAAARKAVRKLSPPNKRVDLLEELKSWVGNLDQGKYSHNLDEVLYAVTELLAAAQRAQVLVRLLTVRQVIEAGNEAIDAAGLNAYCINEGLAEGHERLGFWQLDHAIAAFAPQRAEQENSNA